MAEHIEQAKLAIERLDRAIETISRFNATSGNVSVDLLRDVRDLLARIVEDNGALRS